MKLWKVLIVLAGLAVITGAVFGFATPLQVNAKGIASGGAAICPCTQQVSTVINSHYAECHGYLVDSVTVYQLGAACDTEHKSIQVVLTGTGGRCGGAPCASANGPAIWTSPLLAIHLDANGTMVIPVTGAGTPLTVDQVYDIHVLIDDAD